MLVDLLILLFLELGACDLKDASWLEVSRSAVYTVRFEQIHKSELMWLVNILQD